MSKRNQESGGGKRLPSPELTPFQGERLSTVYSHQMPVVTYLLNITCFAAKTVYLSTLCLEKSGDVLT